MDILTHMYNELETHFHNEHLKLIKGAQAEIEDNKDSFANMMRDIGLNKLPILTIKE